MPSVTPSSYCHLLELPAELREMIWGFATTADENVVEISPETKPPAWTMACDQTREEGLSSWLLSNSFSICIKSDDHIKQIIAFENLCAQYVPTGKMQVKVAFAEEDEMTTPQPASEVLAAWTAHLCHGGNWRPKREDCNHIGAAVITSVVDLFHKNHQAGVDLEVTADMIEVMSWTIDKAAFYARGGDRQA